MPARQRAGRMMGSLSGFDLSCRVSEPVSAVQMFGVWRSEIMSTIHDTPFAYFE